MDPSPGGALPGRACGLNASSLVSLPVVAAAAAIIAAAPTIVATPARLARALLAATTTAAPHARLLAGLLVPLLARGRLALHRLTLR